jgi:class 3 adenylate cyclase
MTDLTAGTVTFLFTDIEGSTRLWERDAAAMQAALDRHDEILRNSIEGRGGHVFKTVGDAFCAVFASAPDALEAALEAQRTLLAQEWSTIDPLRVRMALHAGTANERGATISAPPSTGWRGSSRRPTVGRCCYPSRCTGYSGTGYRNTSS